MQDETPVELASRARSAATELFAGFDVHVEAPADCPADLARQIAAHNAAVAKLLDDRREALDLIGRGPLALLELDATAAQVAEHGQRSVHMAYDVLTVAQRLTSRRGELLADVGEVRRIEAEQAQARYEAEQEKARKLLRKQGQGESDDPRYAVDPRGSEVRFSHRVAAIRSVRDARDEVTNALSRVNAVVTGIQAIDPAVASIGKRRVALAVRLGLLIN